LWNSKQYFLLFFVTLQILIRLIESDFCLYLHSSNFPEFHTHQQRWFNLSTKTFANHCTWPVLCFAFLLFSSLSHASVCSTWMGVPKSNICVQGPGCCTWFRGIQTLMSFCIRPKCTTESGHVPPLIISLIGTNWLSQIVVTIGCFWSRLDAFCGVFSLPSFLKRYIVFKVPVLSVWPCKLWLVSV
jgi:hypothetical protein